MSMIVKSDFGIFDTLIRSSKYVPHYFNKIKLKPTEKVKNVLQKASC